MATRYVKVRPALDDAGKPKLVPKRQRSLMRRVEGEPWPKGAVLPDGERLLEDAYIKQLIRRGDLTEVEEETDEVGETPAKGKRRKKRSKDEEE